MSTSQTIETSDLRAAFAKLMDALEDQLGSQIVVDADHYWHVGIGDAFTLHQEPRVGVGQVSDDLDSVREFVAQPRDAFTAIWHEAEHLAALLRAVAYAGLP